MARQITDECISCGACEPECPNEAITAGDDKYVIDAAKCDECASVDAPMCASACPVADDAIVKLD